MRKYNIQLRKNIECQRERTTKMKAIYFVFLLVILVSQGPVDAKKKTKKYHKSEQKLDAEHQPEELVDSVKHEVPQNEANPDVLEPMDPCEGKCRSGEICQFKDGVAMCDCIPSCPEESDPRRRVCSNLNTTFNSDCELHQMRCWCRSGSENCRGDIEKLSHIHIDYYGQCHEFEECTKGEMADFPRRMRDWLFNVMRDTADRDELSPYYLKMERQAETDIAKRWTLSAIWKFCELDKSNDRTISRHEIFPIRAPLMALEHCIAPFLDKCDIDSNHRITLKEWAKCLEIDEDEIEDRCEQVREGNDEQ